MPSMLLYAAWVVMCDILLVDNYEAFSLKKKCPSRFNDVVKKVQNKYLHAANEHFVSVRRTKAKSVEGNWFYEPRRGPLIRFLLGDLFSTLTANKKKKPGKKKPKTALVSMTLDYSGTRLCWVSQPCKAARSKRAQSPRRTRRRTRRLTCMGSHPGG